MHETIRPKELIHLRRHGQRRAVAASELPPTLEGAYDTAAAVVGISCAQVAGWKLGATTAGTRNTFATEDIYFGALLPEEVWTCSSANLVPAPPVLRGEAEIAFRLAVDIGFEDIEDFLARSPVGVFDAWAPAIEAPYSSVENLVEIGLRALLMDRCAAGALYLGTPRPDINDPSIDQLMEIYVDGSCIAQGSAKTALLMTPLEAARGFLRVAAAQGVDVRRGQWVSTGGITPCVALPFGQPIRLSFGGETQFTIVAQAPRS